MRIGADELKHILLIRHIQEDLKSNDSKYSGILLESEKFITVLIQLAKVTEHIWW